MTDRISLIEGDITRVKVDAIVNAANTTLLGGGGVDGAIHRAAGPKFLEACRGLRGCVTGEAKITGGFNLPARWVIHTVGPVWRGGMDNEDALLEQCYRNSLSLASRNGVKSIAFPSISTGAYGFPIERASRIALRTISATLAGLSEPERVFLVCFSKDDYRVYAEALKELSNAGS